MSPANHKIHSGKKILCGLIPILSFFGGTVCVHADSVSTNAVYNGTWSGSVSGTPGAFQTNTFNSTGGNPALTVTGGVAAFLFNSINNFNGSVIFQGDNTGNSTVFLFGSTNTFGGDLTVNFNQNAQWYNSNNQISGTATVDGNLNINNQSASNLTNTISGLIVQGSGNADLSNSASGSLVNTVTTVKITDSAVVDLANYGSGSLTNTVTTLTLSGGTLRLGGGGSSTAISTMNWSGGEVDFIYVNGSFGNTHVQNLTVSGPVSISLQDNSQAPLTSAAP